MRGTYLFPRNRWKAGHGPVRPALGCDPNDLSPEDPGEGLVDPTPTAALRGG